MLRRFAAVLLLAALAPAAHAGGIHARIEGPAADGRTYTLRMVGAATGDTFAPWGAAEGLVQDERATRLIRFEATEKPGVFTFTRTWPEEGRWLVRVSPGHPPAPATVAELRGDGRVGKQRRYESSDGVRESHLILRPHPKPGEEDC